jgi:malate/lactate dehydrogenase
MDGRWPDGFPRRNGLLLLPLLNIECNPIPSPQVVVVANPSNTNALIVAAHASNLPRANFTCLSRLDQNRTAAQVAQKLNVAYHPEVG